MDVSEIRLGQALGGVQRYLVPLYQRPYSWGEEQLSRLWADLLDVAEGRLAGNSHFTGSLVLAIGKMVPGANEYLVVDGQQRLTTLSILLCALRDHYRAEEDEEFQIRGAELHEKYLIDRFKRGDDRLKLLPTQADRDAYRALIDATEFDGDGGRVIPAYHFFRQQLRKFDDPEDPHDVPRLQDAALNGLAFVSITAQAGDNVYRIFESLNNTGMKLSQGDLIRNYLFMRLSDRAEEVYTSLWLPMQERLSADDLVGLFWLDYVADDERARIADIYALQQRRFEAMTTEEVFQEVARFSRLATLLAIIKDPSREPDSDVRLRLQRLRDWNVSATDPLLLRLLNQREEGRIDNPSLERALLVIESFLVRRLVMGASASGLSRVLLRAAYEVAADAAPADTLLQFFSGGRRYFASDDQIRSAVRTQQFYFSGKPHQKKLFLTWLEAIYGRKEVVDTSRATIEHVLPQTLTQAWQAALSVDLNENETPESVHSALVHTLGNLTLTAYNSELSNRAFPDKRVELQRSGLELNMSIASNSAWGREEILARADALAELVVSYWPAPVREEEAPVGPTWAIVREAIEAIPSGRWTTYGDVAAVAGTYAQPVAGFIMRQPMEGAWRVMQAGGTVASGFRWLDGSPHTGRDVRDVLLGEGVKFDAEGSALAEGRIAATELAELIGWTDHISAPGREADIAEHPRYESFAQQLGVANGPDTVHGVLELLEGWRRLGGAVSFGKEAETSCSLMSSPNGTSWPLTIYPTHRSVEVVFQYLKDRRPFTSVEKRFELLRRLNNITGVDLEPERIEKRPSFPIGVLAYEERRQELLEVLEWYLREVQSYLHAVVESTAS